MTRKRGKKGKKKRNGCFFLFSLGKSMALKKNNKLSEIPIEDAMVIATGEVIDGLQAMQEELRLK